jgi:hypothetical protein
MDMATSDSAEPGGADHFNILLETEDGQQVNLADLAEGEQQMSQCKVVSIDLSGQMEQEVGISLVFETGNGIDNDHAGIFLGDLRLVHFGCTFCAEASECDDGDSCTADSCLHFVNDGEHSGYCWHEPVEACG